MPKVVALAIKHRQTLTLEILIPVAASLFMAVCAQIAVPVALTPVPITLQVLAVFLIGGFLGPRRALTTMFLYITEGLCGLPVFAQGFGGIAALMRPSFGYILGYLPAAFLMAVLSPFKKGGRGIFLSAIQYFFAAVVSLSTIYLCGLAWLTPFVGLPNVLLMGFYPFILIDLAKAAIAAVLLTGGAQILRAKDVTSI